MRQCVREISASKTSQILSGHASERIASLVSNLGQKAFYDELLAWCGTFCPFDSAIVMMYSAGQKPELLLDRLAHAQRENTSHRYLGGAYLLDPFYIHAKLVREPELVRMADIVTADFSVSDYFKNYYKDSRLKDEMNYLIPLSNDRVFAVSISRASGSSAFSAQDIQATKDNLPLIVELVARHRELGGFPTSSGETDPDHKRLEKILLGFGSGVLTPRECEVVQLLLNGYSMQAMSEMLGVSIETARVHRRNIYEKLNISSLAELFALALKAIYAAKL